VGPLIVRRCVSPEDQRRRRQQQPERRPVHPETTRKRVSTGFRWKKLRLQQQRRLLRFSNSKENSFLTLLYIVCISSTATAAESGRKKQKEEAYETFYRKWRVSIASQQQGIGISSCPEGILVVLEPASNFPRSLNGFRLSK